MKNIFILIPIFFYISSYAQEIQVISKNKNYTNTGTVEKFEYIDSRLSLAGKEKIAILEGYTTNSGKNTLASLFNNFWKMSNDFGGNSFTIDTVNTNSDTTYVQISIYFLNQAAFDDNFKLYPKNMVYVFGDLDVKKGNTKKIKLNGEKIQLAPFEYFAYQNTVGEYATVSIGGLLGAKVDIKGSEERLPMFLSLSGFGVRPGSFNQISISFNTGRIYPVDMNFGQFLIDIFSEKE